MRSRTNDELRVMIAAEVGKISYKPGSSFRVVFPSGLSVGICCEMEVPNSCGEGSTVLFKTQYGMFYQFAYDTKATVLSVVQVLIDEMEKHESAEWLKYEGKAIMNPHAHDIRIPLNGLKVNS